MITRLEITNWRAYDHLDLELGAGTTFIVAPNGVGKTSIILALQWALFGDDIGIDPVNCIRAGAEQTTARVELRLTTGSQLAVTRTRKLKGRTTVVYHLDGGKETETDGIEYLEAEFGVPLEIASQLCSMLSAESANSDSLDLKDHLYRAFGVADVVQARDAAKQLLQHVKKSRTELAKEIKARLSDRSELEVQLQDLIESERTHAERIRDAQRVVAESARRDVLLRQWEDFDNNTELRQRERRSLLDRAAEAGCQSNGMPIDVLLEHSISGMEATIRNQEAERQQAAVSAATARHALQQISNSESARQCPTCLRPFESNELEAAVDAQNTAAAGHETTITAHDQALERLRLELAELRSISDELANLPDEPAVPDSPRPDDSITTNDAIATPLDILHRQAGALESERARIEALLADDDASASAAQGLENAFRREALSDAAHRSLAATVDEITRARIDPLADEVRLRWKQIFGSDGLQLQPDGSIVHVIGDRELPWESMSGGERLWARLVTHLLVLTASTTLSFAWFDEPLEHLDPRSRHAVAASLAAAATAGGPKQLIVTTYEHAIAGQLAADSSTASIHHLRPSELPAFA